MLYALFQKLFSGLVDCIMVGFHLRGEVFLKPFILADKVADEVDGYLPFDLNGSLATFGIVEPRFGKPPYPESVGIDAHHSRYVKALYVYIPVGKRVYRPLAQYG